MSKDIVRTLLERKLGDAWRTILYLHRPHQEQSQAYKAEKKKHAGIELAWMAYLQGDGTLAWLEVTRLYEEVIGAIAQGRIERRQMRMRQPACLKEELEIIDLQLAMLGVERSFLADCVKTLRTQILRSKK